MNVQLKRFLVSGLAVVLVVLVGLAGCSVVAPSRAPEATYDFGPQAASGSITRIRMDKAVTVHEVAAPAWLDVPAMHYRLAYSSPSQPRNFANSRWVMSPAALFTQRLKGRFAEASRGVYAPVDGVRTDLVLRVELEEFSQVFDSATAAHGLVRARASLVTPPAATAASISCLLYTSDAADE